jgi:hypothetical protein
MLAIVKSERTTMTKIAPITKLLREYVTELKLRPTLSHDTGQIVVMPKDVTGRAAKAQAKVLTRGNLRNFICENFPQYT